MWLDSVYFFQLEFYTSTILAVIFQNVKFNGAGHLKNRIQAHGKIICTYNRR